MSEREKAVVEKLAEAIDALPEAKKEYLLGYADGVAGMTAKQAQEEQGCESRKRRQVNGTTIIHA